jgi:hypothetical protein
MTKAASKSGAAKPAGVVSEHRIIHHFTEAEVTAILRDELGENSTVDTKTRNNGTILVVAVSPVMNGKTQNQKRQMVLKPLKREFGRAAASDFLILAYGTDELM